MIEINRDPSERQLRQFGALGLPLFLGLVALTLWRRGAAWPALLALLALALCGVVLGLARPRWLRGLFVGWLYAVYPVGFVVSHLLLVVVYFGAVAPLGLLLRLAGRDVLHKGLDRAASSYWEVRPERSLEEQRARAFRQF